MDPRGPADTRLRAAQRADPGHTAPCLADEYLNDDFRDVLSEFLTARVRFLVVGAHALAMHGVPRATGDLDLWIDCSEENARRVWTALARFGAPLESLGVTLQELTTLGTIVQIGLPPRRIDVITSLTRLTFDGAWATRVIHEADGLALPFLGRAALIDNKRAVARPKDLADVDALQRTVPNRTAAPLENLP